MGSPAVGEAAVAGLSTARGCVASPKRLERSVGAPAVGEAAPHGLPARIRHLGLRLLLVERLESGEQHDQEEKSGIEVDWTSNARHRARSWLNAVQHPLHNQADDGNCGSDARRRRKLAFDDCAAEYLRNFKVTALDKLSILWYDAQSTLLSRVPCPPNNFTMHRRTIMSQKTSLRQVEQKVFRSAFQDGLWDIFIGCFILEFAIGPLLSRSLGDLWSSVVFLPFWAIVFAAIWLIRKYVVTPRIGKVEYGSWRRRRLVQFNVVVFAVLLVAFVLGILSATDFATLPGWIHAARFSLIILIAFSVAAYFLDYACLYIYGILFALSPLVGEWLYVYMKAPHHGFPVTFGTTAGIAILVGLAKFIHLLRDYPHPAEELPSEGAYGD